MFKIEFRKKIGVCIGVALCVAYFVFMILDFLRVIDGNALPYMWKELIDLIPVIVLAIFTKEAINRNRRLSKNSLNLEEQGVTRVLTAGSPSAWEMARLFSECRLIKFCSTAGSGFFAQNEQLIREALRRGAEIRVLIAQEDSVYLSDMSEMLSAVGYKNHNTDHVEQVRKSIQFVQTLRAENPKWKIQIRQYRSEYKNRIIMGYKEGQNGDPDMIYGYYNDVVPLRPPRESLLFSGEVFEQERERYVENCSYDSASETYSGNIKDNKRHFIFDMELFFDYLWIKYASTAK